MASPTSGIRHVFLVASRWAAVVLHLAIVAGVLRQPLAVHESDRAYRFPGWRLYHDAAYRMGPGADFFAVYNAGNNAAAGLDIYSNQRAPERFVAPYLYPYRYLPVVAHTLGRAVTTMPPLAAYRAYVWEHHMSAVVVAGALLLLGMRDEAPPGWRWSAAILLALLAIPTHFALIGLDPGAWTFLDLLGLQASKALPALALFTLGAVWLARGGWTWDGGRIIAVEPARTTRAPAAPPSSRRPRTRPDR
jgi:hypothetical protein